MGSGLPSDRERLRRLETALARFSLAALVPYVPVETWLSRGDLTSPGYLCDVIAMALLAWAGVTSLRARPRLAVAPLCAAWGWSASLAWRTYFLRVISRQRGLEIYPVDLRWQEDVLVWVLVVALAAFVASLWLAWRGLLLERP